MAILTMKIFIDALQSSDEIVAAVGDRIFPVAVPGTDDEYANMPLPYIVVGYSGPTNQIDTKDQVWEGEYDQEQVHVLFAGDGIDQLADIEEKGRAAITAYFDSLGPEDENYGLLPDNGTAPNGDLVEFDPWKPSFIHTLTYQCETHYKQ